MPRNKSPAYIQASPWDCEVKRTARLKTIVDIYKHFFQSKIPEDKQYWTMCGAHFDIDVNPVYGELSQLLDEHLFKSTQFYGVDRDKSIIDKNKKLYPLVRWLNGDFCDLMEEFIIKGEFNPAIINYDGVMQPRYGARYLKKILKVLDCCYEDEVLLIANFVLINPYCKSEKLTFSIDEALGELLSIYFLPDHWTIIPYGYVYGGYTNLTNSQMGVLIFIKQKHDKNKILFTPKRKIG